MATYIIDIDGTIADTAHRQWALTAGMGGRPNWDLFFNLAVEDKPFPHMQLMLHDLSAPDDETGEPTNTIIYCSGRPERFKAMTLTWIFQNSYPTPDALYMRKDGDRRPDDIVKLELLHQMLDDGYVPTMAFDDRDRVVGMWRANGIPCAQVAEGAF